MIGGPLSQASWNANANTDLGFPGVGSASVAHPLPDHYYNASQASLMVSGLTSAFQSISNALQATTSSFVLAQPTVTATNNVAYSSSYTASDWSGEVAGAAITGFDSNNNAIYGTAWSASGLLTTRTATYPNTRSIVTCCSAVPNQPGVEFTALAMGTLSTQYAELAAPALSATAPQMLAWLRGSHTQEVGMSGGTLRARANTLGDVVDSSVVGVSPPSTYYSDATNPNYSAFKNACANRTQVAYVGANDGMMHAFNGTVGQANSGQEMFAYIPSSTYNGPTNPQTDGLQSLANPTYVHHFFVDSTPTITDIYIPTVNTAGYYDNSSVPYTTTCVGSPMPSLAKGWMSLLVEGMGKGGRSYFAIDVTDPDAMTDETKAATKVKWEWTDPTMGYSYGEPVVVKTAKYGWTVIVTSGYNTPDGNGYFYFINPATGVLFEPPVKVGTNPYGGGTYAGFITPSYTNQVGMSAATGFVSDYTNYSVDAVYAGDLQGDVWRVDLTGSNPAVAYKPPVLLAQLVSPSSGNPQPITTRLLTEIQPSSNARRILIGTGQLLSTADITSADVQSVYSIVDGTSTPGQFFTNTNKPPNSPATPAPGTTVNFPITRSNLAPDDPSVGVTTANLLKYPEGFYIDLPLASSGAAYRVNVPMAEDQGELAVVANGPGGDACDPSGTHIDLAFDIGSGFTFLRASSNSNSAPVGIYYPPAGSSTGTAASFVQDGTGASHPYFCNAVGGCEQPPGTNPPGTGLTRVNWREIPSPE